MNAKVAPHSEVKSIDSSMMHLEGSEAGEKRSDFIPVSLEAVASYVNCSNSSAREEKERRRLRSKMDSDGMKWIAC